MHGGSISSGDVSNKSFEGYIPDCPEKCLRGEIVFFSCAVDPDRLRFSKHFTPWMGGRRRVGEIRITHQEVDHLAGNPAFGKRIRTLREARKRNDPSYSLRRFAKSVGVSPTFLSKVETGEFDPPIPDKVKRMAELLEQDPDELLALAGRVDPDLSEIIKEQPKAVADFLRTAREHNLSQADIERFTRQIREGKP